MHVSKLLIEFYFSLFFTSLPFCHTGSSCFACCCCCRNAGQDQWPHINLPVPEDQINVFSSSGKINSRGFQSSKYQVPRSINIIFMCVYASLIYGQIITQSLIRVLKIAADRCRSLKIAVDRCAIPPGLSMRSPVRSLARLYQSIWFHFRSTCAPRSCQDNATHTHRHRHKYTYTHTITIPIPIRI